MFEGIWNPIEFPKLDLTLLVRNENIKYKYTILIVIALFSIITIRRVKLIQLFQGL